MTLDLIALAKPEVLESVVRRAPTWEQILAFRQRQSYFSTKHRARQRAAQLANQLRTRAGGEDMAVDVTLEPVHQANPIDRPVEAPSSAEGS